MLAARWPGEGEVLYQLGMCELALGRPDRADEVWGRGPAGVALRGQGGADEGARALKHHRLAVAEEVIGPALDEPGEGGLEAFETLLQLYKIEGRRDEARRLVLRCWGRGEPAGMLQELLRLDGPDPIAVGEARADPRHAPRGPRPTTTGSGSAWPPGDPDRPARRGRAVARRLPRGGARRPGRLAGPARPGPAPPGTRPRSAAPWATCPTTALGPAEVLALRAWFAARAGDAEAERRALEELVARRPRATAGDGAAGRAAR